MHLDVGYLHRELSRNFDLNQPGFIHMYTYTYIQGFNTIKYIGLFVCYFFCFFFLS